VAMAFSFDRALEGKALAPHSAFMGRDPVSVYSPGAPRQESALTQREAARHLDAYGGQQAMDVVHDAIGLYTDAISTAPYKLERLDGTKLVRQKTKGTPPDHEVGPKEVYDLLDRPSQHMIYDELLSLFVMDYMLIGNAYWYRMRPGADGRDMNLYRLAPAYVKIIPGKFGPKRYEYQVPGQRDKLILQPEDVIHFRRPNPHSAFYGIGVIQGGGRSMDMELAIVDTITSYYENKADPSLVVSTERRVSRDVFTKLRAQMRARTAGPKRAGELLVLESGLKADTLGASASDALFDKLMTMSRGRVLQKFRAHPRLLGLAVESGGSTDKISDIRREFDNYTLRPFMKRMAAAINSGLLEAEFGVRMVFDYQQVLPAEEAIKVGESVGKLPGVKIREVRKQYEQFGIEESTGDPDLDEEVLNLPLGNLGPDGQPLDPSVASGADQPLGSEPGRPPKPSNTHAIGNAAGKALPDADGRALTPLTGHRWPRWYAEQRERDRLAALPRRSVGEVSAMLAAKALEDAVRKAEGKAGPVSTPAPDNRLPGEQRPADNFATARKVDIDSAMTQMTAGLRDATIELERGLLDTLEGKALKTSDLVTRVKQSPSWKTFEERLRAILSDGASQAAASGVMHSGLTPDEEIDYDEIAADTINRPDGVRGIIKTLKQRYANKIKEARAADAERSEFETAIRSVTALWNENQAPAIADSEATEAYNEGTLTAAELSGVPTVFVVEEEDAPDKPCQDARHAVWTIDFARKNRKEHPRCRRAFIPLTEASAAVA
jgi:HK97 family phage portal protein